MSNFLPGCDINNPTFFAGTSSRFMKAPLCGKAQSANRGCKMPFKKKIRGKPSTFYYMDFWIGKRGAPGSIHVNRSTRD